MTHLTRLAGKTALVTGGGGGIGRATAARLAEEGADVAIADVDSKAGQVAAELVQARGRRALVVATDLTDVSAIGRAVERVIRELGHLDVLVNNLGVNQMVPMLELSEEDWDRILTLNLKAAFFTMQAAARHMKERKSGKIVNLSSTAARSPSPNTIHYAAAKMGVIAITQGAALALAPYNINVNAICPGVVLTGMWDDIGRGYQKYLGITKEERVRTLVEGTPLRRPQEPEDIAAAVTFLASDDSRQITGHVLDVAGGVVMK